MKMKTLPYRDGFKIVADFEKKQAGYMLWPQRPDNWRDGGKPAQRAFTQLASKLSKYQPMTMLVNENQYKNARSMLPVGVRVVELSSDDAFVKDTGPIYLQSADGQQVRAVDFNFNAWGGLVDGLYFPWDKDNEVAKKLSELDSIDYYESTLTLEGCSVVTDGDGTLLTTEDVILSEGRNKGLTKEVATEKLKETLGVSKIIWLSEGFYLDETGGDIDNMVSFIAPGEIVLSWTEDKSDPQYVSSHRAFEVLKQETDARGRHFRIHKLQIPTPLFLSKEEANGVDPINGRLPRIAGQRLTATYTSYVTTNRAIVLPEFGVAQDEMALEQMKKYYPDREVESIPAREFLTGGGGLHTVVLNVPGV
ncbi:agmatine deiminase [Levilactobacillus wangkuiensis]|uniref:agmatine deiminase n=1 Tax=Levilactobacillus wangkuiensis TaxID=2799566 RepID=UPI001943FAA5|nr:agmatine deiminase [Levilactobacillus wangkuiensis]